MKLCLNLWSQDLAYKFCISQATVSRYFNKWIISPPQAIDRWPNLLKVMPTEPRASFRNCVVIIDYFEIFIERPTNLMVRAQTWLNYKHHNMVKYLHCNWYMYRIWPIKSWAQIDAGSSHFYKTRFVLQWLGLVEIAQTVVEAEGPGFKSSRCPNFLFLIFFLTFIGSKPRFKK